MTNYLHRFDQCFAAFLCWLFFVVCLLMFPIQTIACTDSGRMIRTINVVTSESVSFTYTPASPVKGQPVQFTDTSAGSPILWRWDFGDGTGTTSTSKNPSYTYTTGGTYMVTLTVLYSSGPERAGQRVTVVSELTASFTYSPSSPAEGQAVQFTDTSSGSPTSWQWSFGDGAYSTSQNPSHTYTAAVSYTITLTVTNSSGSKSMSQTITVVPVFAASFTYSPSSPVEGQAVQFTDTSIGSPTSWQWNFGDGATNTSQNPSHPYAVAGCYDMYLTIMKGTNSDTTRQVITVRHIITAASPSYADVSAAISSAVSGDTVIVPAGTAIWPSQLVITKGIKLIGAGIGNTVITSNYTNSDNVLWLGSWFIVYAPNSPALNEAFRLSGFTFNCANKCRGVYIYTGNSVSTPLTNIRVDHNYIYNCYKYGTFNVFGAIWGVADNNIFDGGYISVDGYDNEWSVRAFNFGSADAFYFEDNTIIGHDDCLIRSEMGARWVSRYNTYDATLCSNGLWPNHDMHGNQGSAGWNSCMGVEIYNNTINLGTFNGDLTDQRGGKALVYNNVINTTGTITLSVREEWPDSWNTPDHNLISGQPQHISDTYSWNNLKNGGGNNVATRVTQTYDYGGGHVVPTINKEFWYQGAAFDGTSGVGIGLLSARPTTCTAGVGYWATDTKTLYRATATNVWTAYYTPFTYPHPLRGQL